MFQVVRMVFLFGIFLIVGPVLCSSVQGSDTDKCNAIETRFNELEKRQTEYERNLLYLKSIVEENRSKYVEKRQAHETVAFSALHTGHQTNIGIGQTIRFSQIVLNEGGACNQQNGIFTAPAAGVYLFAFFLGHGSSVLGQVWLELMHNGHKVNAGVADQFDPYEDVQGGNLAILKLQSGDVVWIQAYHQTDAYLDGFEQFTSFSGALLA